MRGTDRDNSAAKAWPSMLHVSRAFLTSTATKHTALNGKCGSLVGVRTGFGEPAGTPVTSCRSKLVVTARLHRITQAPLQARAVRDGLACSSVGRGDALA